MTKIIEALLNSLNGLILTWKSEQAFRLEVILSILIAPFVVFIQADKASKMFVLFSFALVLIIELLNTSLEKANDARTQQQDPLIRFSKDAASSAVFIALCLAGISLLNVFFF
ncbi:MAG: diacylglycerol kinase [Alphaproteobacteria bacterium]|nr:diacylglycerol kinase [Alphaproteobacteria bacterium]